VSANPEYLAQWRADHPEKSREYCRRYYWNHVEERRAARRARWHRQKAARLSALLSRVQP
jgi:hypothetical protein